jgi:hypothetical protein
MTGHKCMGDSIPHRLFDHGVKGVATVGDDVVDWVLCNFCVRENGCQRMIMRSIHNNGTKREIVFTRCGYGGPGHDDMDEWDDTSKENEGSVPAQSRLLYLLIRGVTT